jgi:drug/metabolite transporter (DMT)-like permease
MLVAGGLAADGPGWVRMPSTPEALALGYLATAVTAGAFLAWYSGLAGLGVERAGVLIGLMPIATLATAAAADGLLPDPAQLAGVLVVAVGLALGLGAGSGARARLRARQARLGGRRSADRPAGTRAERPAAGVPVDNPERACAPG